MRTSLNNFCLTAVLTLGLYSTASAALVVTGSFDTSASFFDSQISTTDLINVGQPTLSGPASSTAPAFGPYTVAGSHDGTATLSAGVGYWHTTPTTLTYNLNTTLNPLGYSISNITSIFGFTIDALTYGNQRQTIRYSLVSAPASFIPVTTLSYLPFASGGGSSKVSVTDSAGFLAEGVAALQFLIPISPNGTFSTPVVREIDVFGAATVPVPEPGSCLLLGLGLAGLSRKLRKQRHSQQVAATQILPAAAR